MLRRWGAGMTSDSDDPEEVGAEEETPNRVQSVADFIERVRADSEGWPHVWFRGEPGHVNTPLLPRLYRDRDDGTRHNENKLLQAFRMRAPIFAAASCPDRSAVDQWMFLAQHVGLPTRLLDWTESALVGLYFALLQTEKPVVWMLNPMELNRLSASNPSEVIDQFPLTWLPPTVAVPSRLRWWFRRVQVGRSTQTQVPLTFTRPGGTTLLG